MTVGRRVVEYGRIYCTLGLSGLPNPTAVNFFASYFEDS